MKILEFDVGGKPKPQGSKNGFVKNGRVVLVEAAGKPLKEWRELVTKQATFARIEAKWEPYYEGEIIVELEFRMPKPKIPKSTLPIVRPDIDKLVRAVFDSLTEAHIWKDDSQVVEFLARKIYESAGNPGVHLRLYAPEKN